MPPRRPITGTGSSSINTDKIDTGTTASGASADISKVATDALSDAVNSPELESAFGQIFDRVFDSLLKSFSAAAQRATSATGVVNRGGGPTPAGGGALYHDVSSTNLTYRSSSDYAKTIGTTGVTGTMAGAGYGTSTQGYPLGIPFGQTGTTVGAGAGIARYGAVSNTMMASSVQPVNNPVLALPAAGGTSASTYAQPIIAGGPGTSGAPNLSMAGTPIPPNPYVASSGFAGVPAAPSVNYSAFQGVPAGTNPSRWQNFRSMVGGRFSAAGGARGIAGSLFSGMGNYGANLFGSLAGSATMGLLRSIDDNQQDLINMNMLATQTRQYNSDNMIVNQVTNGAAMNQFGYTQSDIATAMQSYLPFTQGPNQQNNVGIGAFNQLAGFGSATGVGMQSAAQFIGQLGQAGVVGGARGGMGLVPFMSMAATGMNMSAMNNPQDFMNGLSQILQQQTNMGLISSPQISKSITGYYSAFNQTGVAGLAGTQGAGVMNQINQGLSGAMSNPYTAQQAYAALGQNLTPAQISYVTSGGAFNPQALLGGQTPFQKYMNYARNTWGGLDTVSEAFQLAPMIGMSTYATSQLLQSNLMKNLAPSQFNANLKSFTNLAHKAGIDLTSATGQTTVMDLANLAAAGTDPAKLKVVQEQMVKEHVAGASKVNLHSKTAQQDLANLLKKGVAAPEDPIRQSMDALKITMSKFYDRNHTDLDNLKKFMGGFGGLVAAAMLPSLVKGFGSVVTAVLASSIGKNAGIIGTAVSGGVAAGMEISNAWNAHQKDINKAKVDRFTQDMQKRGVTWNQVATDIPGLPFGLGQGLGHPGLQYVDPNDPSRQITVDIGNVKQDPKTKRWYDDSGSTRLYLDTIGTNLKPVATPPTKPSAADAAAHAALVAHNAMLAHRAAVAAAAAAAKAPTTGASGGNGPVTASFDALNFFVPQNAVARLVNGQWMFPGTQSVTVSSRDSRHGGSTGSGRGRNNRQGPGPN